MLSNSLTPTRLAAILLMCENMFMQVNNTHWSFLKGHWKVIKIHYSHIYITTVHLIKGRTTVWSWWPKPCRYTYLCSCAMQETLCIPRAWYTLQSLLRTLKCARIHAYVVHCRNIMCLQAAITDHLMHTTHVLLSLVTSAAESISGNCTQW